MTQADSTHVLRMSLDSRPTHGQRQAEINATTPLPDGWGSFCSKPDDMNPGHWYATPPYNVDALVTQYGKAAHGLARTVYATTWPKLHAAVAAQVDLYAALTGGEAL
jgi:hypothetical protein